MCTKFIYCKFRFQGLCFMNMLNDFFRFKRYNLHQIANTQEDNAAHEETAKNQVEKVAKDQAEKVTKDQTEGTAKDKSELTANGTVTENVEGDGDSSLKENV